MREERVGQVTSHSKEKSKILELIIEAASSHDEGFGDRRIIF